MARLRNIVYLTEADKQTLFSTGTVTVGGTTITYSDNDIYIVPQLWNTDGSASNNFLIKDNTNTTRLTLSNAGVVTAAGFEGSGALLTSLNGANITTGVISTARLATGTADSTKYLRGDGTWATTFTGTVTGTGTANQIAYWTGTSAIGGLNTTTYPSLTELSYVKGVTSAIQTQLNAKAPLASPTFTGTVVLPSTTSIGSVDSTEIGYLDGVTSAIQTQLNTKANYGSTANADSTYLYRSFSMLENVSPQYILLCANGPSNDVSGTIDIDRTTGNYQSARLDIIVTSGTGAIYGGSLTSHQNVQTAYPNEEKFDLVTLTYNSISYVAVRYTGNTYPSTVARFSGRLVSSVGGSLTTVDSSVVTNVADFTNIGKFNFDVANVEINENVVWHAGNDGTGSGLDADLLDGLNSSSANTISTIVARDASGNFSAGTITASLTGTASGNLPLTGGTLTGTLNLTNADIGLSPGYAVALSGSSDPTHRLFHDATTDYDVISYSTGFQLRHFQTGNQLTLVGGTGNVGIGTASPDSRLAIQMTGTTASGYASASNAIIKLDSGTATNSVINLVGGGELGIYHSNSSGAYDVGIGFGTNADRILRFDTAGAEKMRILANGNVGIGTSSPTELLHLRSATPTQLIENSGGTGILKFTSGGNINYIQSGLVATTGSQAPLYFTNYNGANTRMVITGDGFVGINETSPSAQLQVKSGATTRVPLIIDTVASQTANLAEFKFNTATKLVVTKDGKLQAGSGDGEIHVTSSGVRIETLADNAFVPLTVNKDDTNTSAHLQDWQVATNTVAYVDEGGEFYAPSFVSINGASSGSLSLQGSPVISRNINDATATLTVNNANASSTGNLLNLQAGGTNVISFRKDGTLLAPATFTIDPSTHDNIAGKVIILGDLQVDGTTTTINSTTIDVADKNVVLSKGAVNKAASDGGGITIDLGTDGTASLLYGSTADEFTFNKGLNVSGQVEISSANFPPLLTERTTSSTNTVPTALSVLTTTSGDMVDGFGTNVVFGIRDSANTINYIGAINAIRSGADGSGRLAFNTSTTGTSTEKMTIMPNGRVGIGTTAPNDNLHIGAVGAVLRVGPHYPTIDATSDRDFITLTAGSTDSVIATINETFTIQNSQSAGIIRLNTEGTEKVRIAANGNVGIGTSSPAEILHISGGSGPRIEHTADRALGFVRTGANTFTFEHDTARFYLYNATTAVAPIVFSNNGNVGIGTTSPGEKLHVVGKALLNNGGNFYIDSTSSNVSLATDGARGIILNTNSTNRLAVTSAGDVGIGTITPQDRLTVSGTLTGGTSELGIINTEGGKTIIRAGITGQSNNGTTFVTANSDGTNENIRMVIGSTGNVGIGTNTPLNKLEVRVTGGDSNDGLMITRDDTTTTTDEILGGIGFDSTDGNVPSSVLEASAYVAAFAAEDHSTGDKGGYLTFGTAPIDQDDDTVSVERMRIKADGYVGIGTTTTPHRLTVADNVGANGFYASDRIVFGDIVNYDTPYIGWNGSSTPYQLRIADPAYENPIIIDTENVSVSADKFIANNTISVGSSLQGIATVTTTSTTQTVLSTYAVATYATGKFIIQATSGGNRHVSELLVTHNGTVSTATEYGILKTAGNLFTVTTDISGGSVRILVTSASATSTVYRTTFTLIGV